MGIHIKKSKKGTFTKAATAHGKSVQSFASQVLSNKENYSPAMVKKANFARNASKWKHAMGGTVQPNVPVEVEDDEVAQLPNGQVMQFDGATHEDGGIPVSLPEGTYIFSDRISVDGKTMQERKMIREKKENSIKKKLGKNPTDFALKNSLKRTQETNMQQEQHDMMVQEMSRLGSKKFAKGGMVKYEDGGAIGAGMTAGNWIGTAGTIVNSLAPLLTTLANRRADKPNRNFFKGFNQAAIETNDQGSDLINQQKNNALSNLRLRTNSIYSRNRNSVQSLNTLNALNAVTDLGQGIEENEINNQALTGQLGVLGRKSQMQTSQDYYQRMGEQQKDLADRQTTDNFYSNLNQDIGNIGTGLQQVGGMMNKQKQQNDFMALLPELSKYGVGIEYVNGRPTLVNAK